MLYGFIALIITITVAVFGIITSTSDSSKDNSRRIFESSLWNALQLQVQSYRLLNYLIELDESDYPLNGRAFFEYDLLMSRIDLLREGQVGSLIQGFEEGRTTRLLNIINGELELLSLNLSKIEMGDHSYLPELIVRIKQIEVQTNEFIALVNKGSNEYITDQHRTLQRNLDYIQLLSIALLIGLLCLCFFIVKGLAELNKLFRRNSRLEVSINSVYKDRAEMLAFIHQEIRSPINAILGIAKTLHGQKALDVPTSLSTHIEESGQQLLQTIGMFSDLALIDAKQLTLSPTTENLPAMLESYLAELEPQLTRKGLICILYIDPQIPSRVHLDFARVKEILITLLQNAITYTPSGSISLQIRPATSNAAVLQSANGDTRVMQIAIRDTGLGMPTELQHNLRVNPSLPMQQEGPLLSKVGVSLTLCHKLVYLMKGEMHFSCAPGKGSEFWVDIPFDVTNHAASDKFTPFLCPPNTQVLVVETDIHLAKIIGLQLASFNMDVTLSKEGDLQAEIDVDLVILGNTHHFKREGLDALEQWQERSCPVLSYHPQASLLTEFAVIPLQFPLTQSQFEPFIRRIFAPQNHPAP
ncbi:sensor histidine kinase [Marinomonas sp. M1K-6]|uniref:histidine kinase n=2 Tax=Marinomonas profundi TaxID=2726122 RepID=A0A847QXI8_9GAMM|nr:sensor histidine kinase [Marinomonas profundi]UDV04846.1 sensor histidine kinase [Marinomonas profundi]